jgi:hypothetical protein
VHTVSGLSSSARGMTSALPPPCCLPQVDFWAPWCGPCRMIAPLVDEISAEYGDRLRTVSAGAAGQAIRGSSGGGSIAECLRSESISC